MVITIIQWGKNRIDWPNIGVNSAFALFVFPLVSSQSTLSFLLLIATAAMGSNDESQSPWTPQTGKNLYNCSVPVPATNVLPNNQC